MGKEVWLFYRRRNEEHKDEHNRKERGEYKDISMPDAGKWEYEFVVRVGVLGGEVVSITASRTWGRDLERAKGR